MLDGRNPTAVLGFDDTPPSSIHFGGSLTSRAGVKQLSNEEDIMPILTQIIADNPKQTEEYKNGKDKLFGFFVGQAMKATKGQANPEILNKLLRQALND